MAKLTVGKFVRANPEIDFKDDGDGVVTEKDKAFLYGEQLSWNDQRYKDARQYAETGERNTDLVSPWAWFMGAALDIAAFKVLAPIALFHGAMGETGTFTTRVMNVFTYLPRAVSALERGSIRRR